MLQLVLHVCLLTAPASCHDEYLNSRARSIEQCMSDQVSMADWINHNPEFAIDRWRCVKAGTEADL